MAKQDPLKMLASVPIFEELSTKELKSIASSAKEVTHREGHVLAREGESGVGFFLILEGDVAVAVGGRSMRKMGPGDFFGETTLIEMHPRHFSVVVERDARLLELTNADLYNLYLQDVKSYVLVLQNINRELCRRLRRASNRITAYADEAGDEVTQIRTEPAPPRAKGGSS